MYNAAAFVWLGLITVLPSTIRAQTASPWGQCGGSGWSGATICPTGWTCTYSNDWYSQCLQSSSTVATTSSKSTTTTTSSKSTTVTTTSKSTTATTSSKSTTTTTSSASSTTSKSTTSTTTTSASATPSGAGPSRLTGKLPALGWNSWNAYRGDINEAKILAAANNITTLGLKAAGYVYVNIDDCWSDINGRDATTQRIKPDPIKFPNGISSVATQIHALGLKIGIYSDAGTKTCAGFPGSLEYETIDAQTWSEWGIDYIKYDNCNVPSSWTDSYNIPTNYDWYLSNSAIRYRRMTDALATVSRPIQYGICNWGNANVWAWGARVGHSWRLSGDSSASWSYVTSIINTAVSVIQYVDFYAHGDLDMMEIGNGDLTINEQRTHFAAWVFLKSPILLGTNLGALSTTQLAIIKNAELLAFSQDNVYGKPAKPYKTGTNPPEFYSGTSSLGIHVFVINLASSAASKVITFSEVPELAGATSWKIHNMWTGLDLGTFSTSYSITVDTHDTAALRFNPV